MKIENISIHIEFDDTATEVVFSREESIAEIMSCKDSFPDMILDIINNAKNDMSNR